MLKPNLNWWSAPQNLPPYISAWLLTVRRCLLSLEVMKREPLVRPVFRLLHWASSSWRRPITQSLGTPLVIGRKFDWMSWYATVLSTSSLGDTGAVQPSVYVGPQYS